VRPYARGQKNDFNNAEAIAEAVPRPTMKDFAPFAERLVGGDQHGSPLIARSDQQGPASGTSARVRRAMASRCAVR